ncbi:four helix bundle protein [Halocola ammonii]
MSKKYDLEERTFLFAKDVRCLVRSLPGNTVNFEDGKQLVRASGSVGANYIEANEKLGQKDFLMRAKISRKEAKECIFFLRLLLEGNEKHHVEISRLMQEANELKNILSAIIRNTEMKE